MPRRTEIKGVIDTFLSSFTSRYSDYDGYWIFGLLVDEDEEINIDLLAPFHSNTTSVVSVVKRIASDTFQNQIAKYKLPPSVIHGATLKITKTDKVTKCCNHGMWRDCVGLRLCVQVLTDLGRQFERERLVFAAPHDPNFETRSARRLSLPEYRQ